MSWRLVTPADAARPGPARGRPGSLQRAWAGAGHVGAAPEQLRRDASARCLRAWAASLRRRGEGIALPASWDGKPRPTGGLADPRSRGGLSGEGVSVSNQTPCSPPPRSFPPETHAEMHEKGGTHRDSEVGVTWSDRGGRAVPAGETSAGVLPPQQCHTHAVYSGTLTHHQNELPRVAA